MEVQALTKILEEKTLKPLIEEGIDEKYFVTYTDEAVFIYNHYREHGTVPTKDTFLKMFTAFELVLDTEPWSYCVTQLTEGYLFSRLSKTITDVVPIVEENAFEGLSVLQGEINSIKHLQPLKGKDIVRDANDRLLLYKKNLENPQDVVLPTGLPEMDEILNGWYYGEELVVIAGRTNEGKTWLLLKYLVEAWKQGKRVGLFSGEMGINPVGYRFDTLLESISNSAISKGEQGVEGEYQEYIVKLGESEIPFIVITPHSFTSTPTVADMEAFVTKYELDVLGIDQLYHLAERKPTNNPMRLKLDEISMDLFELSGKLGIPILTTHQANRDAKKESKSTPELEHLAESDAIVRNSSRVITMRGLQGYMEITPRKNRNGKKDITFTYFWDIDLGIFKYVDQKDESTPYTEGDSFPIDQVQGGGKTHNDDGSSRRKYPGEF